MRHLVAAGLAVLALVAAVVLGERAQNWNDELELASPLARVPAPALGDPRTPRLTGRVVLVVIDGLGADEAALPYLDALRARGASAVARVPYPTISRPNYVTILTGVPPADSGVRTNRVHAPVAVDSIMDRVQAAGLRVVTASDYGSLSSLFLRHTDSLSDVSWREDGARRTPRAPVTWPFDAVYSAPSLAELGAVLADVVRTDAAFIPVLVLDVDRAGHAEGVGPAYRAAAADVDRMLRAALAGVDLERDTVIVTADHGHVAPGGHGGTEAEVSHVPVVLAGRGIVRGAAARDPATLDLSPTVAALLGVPAPRHAEGRTLVEVLDLSAAESARRVAADQARQAEVAAIMHAARASAPATSPDAERLCWLGAAVALGVAGARMLRRALVITRGAAVGVTGFVSMLVAMVAVTRGHVSPSYIPTLARTQTLVGIGVAISLLLQVGASWRVVRRARDRLAAANGLATTSLGLALTAVALVRAWFSPPFLTVPGPTWLVAIPAVDLAAATCAVGTAVLLAVAMTAGRSSSRRPASS